MFENFLKRLKDFPTSYREEVLNNFLEQRPDVERILLEMILDHADLGDEEEFPEIPTNSGDLPREYDRLLNDVEPSYPYEDQIFNKSLSQLAKERYVDEANKAYQAVREDNSSSRRKVEFQSNLLIVTGYIIPAFFIIWNYAGNALYDPCRPEDVNYNRLAYSRLSWGSQTLYNIIGKPMTQVNYWVMVNIFNRLHEWSNWASDIGGVPHMCCKAFFKVMEYSSRYIHLKLNLLGWSAYFAPHSLIWNKIVYDYNSYLNSRASRNVIINRVSRLLSSSRAEVGGRYASLDFARAHNLRNISTEESLTAASEEVASLMSGWIWALAKPKTYDFSNDTTKLNVVLFKESGETYMQSIDFVTYSLLKDVRKNSLVNENTYNEYSNYASLPIPQVNKSEGIPITHQVVEWICDASLNLVKDLITWTGRNWEHAEVDFLYKGSKKILWRIRPQFDKWVKEQVKTTGTKVKRWLDSKAKELSWGISYLVKLTAEGIEWSLPEVKVPEQPEPASVDNPENQRLRDKLESIWKFSWNSCLFFYYCGWSAFFVVHNVWGVMLGELSFQDLLPAKKKSSEEESPVVDELPKVEKRSWLEAVASQLPASVVNFFPRTINNLLIRESDDRLVMQEVSEDMNVGNDKIVGSRLSISLSSLPERVFLHSLGVSDWLLNHLNDAGLSDNEVIMLYLNRLVWPDLNLDMVQGKGVFLKQSLEPVSRRIPLSNGHTPVNKFIQDLEKLQQGWDSAYGNVRTLSEIPKGDDFLFEAISHSGVHDISMFNPSILNVKLRELQERLMIDTRFHERVVHELAFILPSSDINLAVIPKYWTFNDNSRLVKDRSLELSNILRRFHMVIPSPETAIPEPFLEIYNRYLQRGMQLYDWPKSVEDKELKVVVARSNLHRSMLGPLPSVPEIMVVGDEQMDNVVESDVENNDDMNATDSKEMDEHELKESQPEVQLEESALMGQPLRVQMHEAIEKFDEATDRFEVTANKIGRFVDAPFSTMSETAAKKAKEKAREVFDTLQEASDNIPSGTKSALLAGVTFENSNNEDFRLDKEPLVESPREEATIEASVQATEVDPSFSMDEHRRMQASRACSTPRSSNLSIFQASVNLGHEKRLYQKRELLEKLIEISIRYLERLEENTDGLELELGTNLSMFSGFRISWLRSLNRIRDALRDESSLQDCEAQYGEYLEILNHINTRANQQANQQLDLIQYQYMENEYNPLSEIGVQTDHSDDSGSLTYREVFNKIVEESKTLLEKIRYGKLERIASSPSQGNQFYRGLSNLDGTNYMPGIASGWLSYFERHSSKEVRTPIVSSAQSVTHSEVGDVITPSSDLKATDTDELEQLRIESADRIRQAEYEEHFKEVEWKVNLDHRFTLLLESLFNLISVEFLEEYRKYDIDDRVFDPNLQLTQNNMDVYLQSNALRNMVTLLIKHLKDRNQEDPGADMLLRVFFSDREVVAKEEDDEDDNNFNIEARKRNLDLAHDRITYLREEVLKYLEHASERENANGELVVNDDYVTSLIRDKNIFYSFFLDNLDFYHFNQLYESELSNLDLEFSPEFFRSNWLRQLERYRQEFFIDVNLVEEPPVDERQLLRIEENVLIDRMRLPRVIQENVERMQRDSSNKQRIILRERAMGRVQMLLEMMDQPNSTQEEVMVPPLESGVSLLTGRHTTHPSLQGDLDLPPLEASLSLRETIVADPMQQLHQESDTQQDDTMAVELPDNHGDEFVGI